MTLSRTDIIGNGASNHLYKGQGLNVIACNIPQHGHTYNALSIIDLQPLTWMKNNNYSPRVPVFCTQKVKDNITRYNLSGDWFPVYEQYNHWNSGIHAADYWASKSKEIHLWGFDSMFSNDLTSQMDNLVIRQGRPNLNRWWTPIWKEVFDKHPNVKFWVHAPLEHDLNLNADNCAIINHLSRELVNNVEG